MPGLTNEILRLDYNQMQSAVFNVLGATPAGTASGYGQVMQSSQVLSTSPQQLITEVQWDNLRADINKAFKHQTGNDVTLPNVSANVDQVTTQILTNYQTVINTIVQNKNVIAANQKPATPVLKQQTTFTSGWSQSVTQTVTVSFQDANSARYFFNAGSTINFESSLTEFTQTPPAQLQQNQSWANLLAAIGRFSFDAADFYTLTSSDQLYFQQAATSPYSINYYRVQAKCNVNQNNPTAPGYTGATTVTFKIEWIDNALPNPPFDAIFGKLTSTITETKPSGGVVVIDSPTYVASAMVGAGTPTIVQATFSLTSDVVSVNEGGNINFTFTTLQFPSGREFTLTISGVNNADLISSTTGSKLLTTTGNFTQASFTYTVNLRNDFTTEGVEKVIATVVVPVDPVYGGGQTETLEVTVNDTSTTPTPRIQLQSTAANSIAGESFGSPATISIQNTGTANLIVTNVQYENAAGVTGQLPDYNGLGGLGSTTIVPQAQASFTVAYSSNTNGSYTNVVKVTSNANLGVDPTGPTVGSIKSVNVAFNVGAAVPNAALTAVQASVSFGTDGITAGSASQTFRITNSGNAKLTVNGLQITNSTGLSYTITSTPVGQEVAAGAQKEFTINWSSTVVGTKTPRITVDTTGGNPFVDSTVNVIASVAGINTSLGSISASGSPGQTKTTKFYVTNTGTSALNVTGITIANKSNEFITISALPTTFTVQPNASPGTEVTVTYSTTRSGTSTANVVIASNATNNPSLSIPFSYVTAVNSEGVQYSAQMSISSSTNFTTKAVGAKGTAITVTVSGLAPGEIFYAYHEQASGKITGHTGTKTAQQLFQEKFEYPSRRTVSETGVATLWDGSNPTETESWEIGTSKLWMALPISKDNNGVVSYYNNGLFYTELQIQPTLNLQLISAAEYIRPYTSPYGSYTLELKMSGMQPNANFGFVVWRSNFNSALGELGPDAQVQPAVYTTVTGQQAAIKTDATGNVTYTQTFVDPDVGTYNIKVRQTSGGQTYDSNTVTVTVKSQQMYAIPSQTRPSSGTPPVAGINFTNTSTFDKIVTGPTGKGIVLVQVINGTTGLVPTPADKGFVNGDIVAVFGVQQNISPYFNDENDRTIRSKNKINLTSISTLPIMLNKGTQSQTGWGQRPDNTGENLKLRYSLDGVTWILLYEFKIDEFPDDQWKSVNVTVPAAAKTQVYLEFRQDTNGGEAERFSTKANDFWRYRDTWAIANTLATIGVDTGGTSGCEMLWVEPYAGAGTPVLVGQTLKIIRAFTTTLSGEFTLHAEADDQGAIEINGYTTPNGFSFGPTGIRSFTIPSGTIQPGRNRISLIFANTFNNNNFDANPGYIGFKLVHTSTNTVVLTSNDIKNNGYF